MNLCLHYFSHYRLFSTHRHSLRSYLKLASIHSHCTTRTPFKVRHFPELHSRCSSSSALRTFTPTLDIGSQHSLRYLHTSHTNLHDHPPDPRNEAETVRITYILRDGTCRTIAGCVGDNVMHLAHKHDIDIEGACEASLACCTCHVYVEEEYFDKLGEICEDEEDMLDMAPELRECSRLSCQITLEKELDGITVEIPRITRNFYVDGHTPQPH